MKTQPALRDVLAGSTFIVFGLGFAVAATQYQIGTPARMGPGYFPLVLGGLLVLFGTVIVVKAFVAGEAEPIGSVPWKATVLILAAVLLFGFTVRGLGLVPSLFVAVFLAALASERTGAVAGLVIAVGLTVLRVLIFVVALQLRLPLLGPWVGG